MTQEKELKVGDRIRIINENCCRGWDAGTVGIIDEIDDTGTTTTPLKVKFDGDFWWACPLCVEIVSEDDLMTVIQEETVTIPKDEYDKLVEASTQLSYLEAAGVDNWSGYSYAWELRQEDEN